MRTFLIVGLVVLAGCATSSRPRDIEWNQVAPRSGAPSQAVVQDGQLLLPNTRLRSTTVYTKPLVLECEIQSAMPFSTNHFFIGFVPLEDEKSGSPSNSFSIEVFAERATLYVSQIQNMRFGLIAPPMTIQQGTEGRFQITVELQPSNVVVRVNAQRLQVERPVPYDKFQIELGSVSPVGPWRVTKFSVH